MTTTDQKQLREQVRARYADAAIAVTAGSGCGCGSTAAEQTTGSCCGPTAVGGCCLEADSAECCTPGSAPALDQSTETFGAGLYSPDELEGLPADALAASLGCGNPLAVADLHPGERVLDLGSGGGIDVLLSARRVGLSGHVYGVDMTDEMLALARANAAKDGASNVEFVKGTIEDIPLPDDAVDVVISNCVINLSIDKPAVLREMFRVLTPGGRIGISDVVAEDHVTAAERAERASYVDCLAGTLSRSEYLDGLTAVGFTQPEVIFTHQAADGLHAAIIRATKPTSA